MQVFSELTRDTAALFGAGLSLYGIYAVKTKLGIDLFPRWGLHLPVPRSLRSRLRRLFSLLRRWH